MTIINFTPLSAFTGGILIGFAAFLFFVFNGRMAGISSIAANSVLEKDNKIDNILFLIGLILGPVIFSIFGGQIESKLTNSILLVVIAGLLVGVGTKIGSGCTSGHGICGISRISIRSIIATISFLITGILTVLLFGVQ